MNKPKKKRSGRHALKHPVKIRGPQQLDLRTAGAQALAVWRHEMIEHLGGQEAVSVPRRFLVERVVSTELLIQDADRDLLAMESTVQDHRYVALVRERQTLIDSQARLLGMLGLMRVPAPAKTLEQIVAEIADQREQREQASPDQTVAEDAQQAGGQGENEEAR